MRLRSCKHLHYIQTIKDGSIERLLNVDSVGRLKLKFRQLDDIYKKESPGNDYRIPQFQPRADRNLENVPDMTYGLCLNIKHEPEDYEAESKASDGKRSRTCYDLGFGDITLKQMRKQCKTKKRKRQNHRSNSESCQIKQEFSTLQPEDEGCDVEKPLSCGEIKVRKEKKSHKLECYTASSPSIPKGNSEPLEDCHPVSEAKAIIPEDSSTNCNKAAKDSGMVTIKVLRTSNSGEKAISDEFIELLDTASVSGDENMLGVDSEETDPQNSDNSLEESGNNDSISSEISLECEESIDQVTGSETVLSCAKESPSSLARSCDIQSCDKNNVESSSELSYKASMAVNDQQEQLHRPPEKLLSGRKVISPTSQAKLRKAMEQQSDSPLITEEGSKIKLQCGVQKAHRILTWEGSDYTKNTKVSPESKQIAGKVTPTRKKIRRQKIRESEASRRFSTSCPSIQSCSENAIAFSQRQMHDIQNLAAKLTNELHSLMNVTERCLQGRTHEVKAAIRNAEKGEETARKWLSIMERDCNRFCKLMGIVVHEGSSAASKDITHEKEKKKRVRFADEAGRDLCHVKLYETDSLLPSLSEQ